MVITSGAKTVTIINSARRRTDTKNHPLFTKFGPGTLGWMATQIQAKMVARELQRMLNMVLWLSPGCSDCV